MKHLSALGVLVLAASPDVLTAAGFSRDLSTDRPDATESPYSVEAGRWQVESEPVRWSTDRVDGVQTDTWVVGAFNAKRGLSPSTDLQVVFEPYVHARVESSGATESYSGNGDVAVRLKINMRGNDTDGLAWALMPFVKLPVAADDFGNGDVEGGLILPVAFDLNERWGCGLMAEVDIVRNAADDGYRAALVTTATVATDLTPDIGFFLELASEAVGSDSEDWAATFNAGLTFALGPDRQIDCGINVGLTDAAEDFAAFGGYTWRW